MPRSGNENEIIEERPSHEIDLSADEKGKGAQKRKMYKGPSTEKNVRDNIEIDLSVDDKHGKGAQKRRYYKGPSTEKNVRDNIEMDLSVGEGISFVSFFVPILVDDQAAELRFLKLSFTKRMFSSG